MEGVTKIETLLGVEVYRLSENFIHDLREKSYNRDRIFDILPEFTTNTNTGQHNQPMYAKYFHQFVGWIKSEKSPEYLYFNLNTVDKHLELEISEQGIEDIFKDYDFEKVLSVFPVLTDEDFKKNALPHTHYLIMEIIYVTSYDYYSGGWDCDIDVNLVGYLDGQLNKKYFKDEEIYKGNDN